MANAVDATTAQRADCRGKLNPQLSKELRTSSLTFGAWRGPL